MKKILVLVFALMILTASLFAQDISKKEAEDIALSDAGLTSSSVSALRSHKDRDDGTFVYDVSFRAGDKEYEYEIEISDGFISEKKWETYKGKRGYDVNIESSEALSAALINAGVKDYSNQRVHLDSDDGQMVYEVEFSSSSSYYKYKINAADSSVVEKSVKNYRSQSSTSISEKEAVSLVLSRVDGASEDDMYIYKEYDDGRLVYKGELWSGRYEYEFEIDASTGRFLEWDKDRI